jgi:hypothetical protein
MSSLYYCKKCEFKSTHKQSADNHLKSIKHTKGYIVEEVNYECKCCCKQFKYKSTYRTHLRSKKHKRYKELTKVDLNNLYNVVIIG